MADQRGRDYQRRIVDLEAISARHSAEAAHWQAEAQRERTLSQQAQSELLHMLRGLTLRTQHSMLANSDEFKTAQAYLRQHDAGAGEDPAVMRRRQGQNGILRRIAALVPGLKRLPRGEAGLSTQPRQPLT
ncbi:MAG: hypothetical protein WD847_06030 [Pirellulales bacterium]